MGWQERDWAKWTDAERSHFLGSTTGVVPGAFIGVVVSLVATVMFGNPFHARKPVPIYSDGKIVQLWGRSTTCTEIRYLPSGTICGNWRFLVAHEQVLPATPLPAGTRCGVVVADQASHRWVCATPS